MIATEDDYIDNKVVSTTGAMNKKHSILSRLVTGTLCTILT